VEFDNGIVITGVEYVDSVIFVIGGAADLSSGDNRV
jgi:hypothetical protein